MARRGGWWLGLVLCVAAAPAGAADLLLKRVMLSSGGVGYLEYQADVEGDAALSLEVALDQVDDVLKSLVIYDTAGTAGEITLPGRNPLTQSLADLPFDRAALNSAVDLLNALQGTEIRVERADRLTGRLLHAEREIVPGSASPPLNQTRVTLLTGAGLQQFVLQDAAAISFVDPALQNKVADALQRIAAYHDEARRRLLVNLHGAGRRTIRVGYVVGMPLWKASYRLSLPSDAAAGTARLQGWAVLENMSSQAWQDVELTLLSGNPVTFRQALYESYYVTRPAVPVESGGHVLPPPDTGTVAAAPMQSAALPSPAAPIPSAAGTALRKAAPFGTVAPPPAAIEPAAASQDETQVAFTLPYKVSAAAGQSVMLPLLDHDLPARRLDLYQPSSEAQHPLAAIEMVNTADASLPPGVLTLYEQAANGGALYIGDARLAAFPGGEKRLLSYAVDNRTTIDRNAADQSAIVTATIADGVLRLTHMQQRRTVYRIKAAAAPVSLILEHPRRAGWTLKQPEPSKIEMTGNAYRMPIAANSPETAVTVIEEQPIEETVALTDLADDRLEAFAASSELDPSIRQVMGELAKRRQAIARQRAELERLEKQRGQLGEDEARLRDNLAAIGNEAGLRQRLLEKFNQIEMAIDNTGAAVAQAETALANAERELAGYVAQLHSTAPPPQTP